MKRHVSARISFLVTALFLVTASFCGVSASAQGAGSGPSTAKASMAAVEESTPSRDDASHQGIKVHGHWKIVVKNADGSVAETREFENSLTTNGASVLAQLISGASLTNGASGGLAIDLTTTGTSICGKPNCGMVPNTTGGVGYGFCVFVNDYCSPTALTTTVNGGSIVLAGQIAATQTGTITAVSTQMGTCSYSVSASTCGTTNTQVGSAGTITSTTVAAVAVNSGQVVQVSVTISFS
jgi:hypothetical protein